MSENLKPCPFCGVMLEKHHTKYKAIGGEEVKSEWYEHPANDCFLMNLEDWGIFNQSELEQWNRRTDNGN